VLRREQANIFRSLWIFAGPSQLVSDDNAYITRAIGGLPLVIQNLGGTIRAFENQCLHRRMALQWEAVGQRPLICRYHGWTYDGDLRVKSVPNAAYYNLNDECRRSLRLREFAVRQVGNLLFVNLSDTPLPFEDQFSADLISTMEQASLHFDSDVAYAHFHERYNWKLNFENVLDYNHVQFIHPKSFFPILRQRLNAENNQLELSPRIRPIQAQLDADSPIDLRELSYHSHSPLDVKVDWWASQVDRYGSIDDYYNWFIYPNVNFCSVHGRMFLIQQFIPMAPGISEYHLWVMTARRHDRRAQFTPLLWALIKAEKRVIDEDAVALEQLQKKMHSDADRCQHGIYEAHIVRMMRWYANAMSM
jgi:phenylpropionate dioxygenase-like ring-hydroxylating dioxygenase large terminal subunit